MNNAFTATALLGKRQPDMSIDWEFLPSLSHLIDRKEAASGHEAPVWAETMPADFDAMEAMSDPFREPLEGLAMREVNEPEIFRAFFG